MVGGSLYSFGLVVPLPGIGGEAAVGILGRLGGIGCLRRVSRPVDRRRRNRLRNRQFGGLADRMCWMSGGRLQRRTKGNEAALRAWSKCAASPLTSREPIAQSLRAPRK